MTYFIGFCDAVTAALYILLGPILILQGAFSRHRVINLPEPPGPRAGCSGAGQPLNLLVLGDSAGAGVGAPVQRLGLLGQLLKNLQDRYKVHWKLWASTGNTTTDTLTMLEESPPERFDVVVVSLGVNDITEMVPALKWLRMQEELVSVLTGKFSARQVFLASLPPMSDFPLLPQPLRFCLGIRAKLFTLILAWRFRSEPKVVITTLEQPFSRDMMAMDGFHPGPPVYEIWAKDVSKYLL